MNKKELKKVIKQLVKESLTEIFAEMHLETIVEKVVNKKNNCLKENKNFRIPKSLSSIEEEVKEEEVSKEEKRRLIMEKMGVDEDSMWSDIYEDTVNSDNPVLTGEKDNGNPELVSESALKRAGLMKDYSKFV